jgi:hypothetical protein
LRHSFNAALLQVKTRLKSVHNSGDNERIKEAMQDVKRRIADVKLREDLLRFVAENSIPIKEEH